ncbi:hypothetical protein J3E64_001159 [Sphingobium sp. OAS761]|uniref:hypothetical protein n=1 Tax=Sphingobium sp. OAS761 TaxID=2817901 RepID=UPI0020A1CE38|nr:hypothetical protein [Sphingobium sp. OAS761]MCP1469484.1 hypothetical protein [Sphingobium sp. OAS761]
MLNVLADDILDNHAEFVNALADFKLLEGRATFLGSGESEIERITLKISYKELDKEKMEEIEQILEIARGFSSISVTLHDE